MALVRSAGGVLWQPGPRGPRLALVHRPGRRDWSLPKGRLRTNEGWRAAALREIAEETGCQARITGFAGAKIFVARRDPKLVLYWHMQVVREGALEALDEVDDVAWLTPRQALERLDHGSDRRLLRRALAGWAWHSGRPEAVRPLDATELDELLVVDELAAGAKLVPYLRLVRSAVARV